MKWRDLPRKEAEAAIAEMLALARAEARPVRFPAMRPQLELQRVHDLLNVTLTTPEVRELLPNELLTPLKMTLDCLCWALHHEVLGPMYCEGAPKFADLVFWLEHILADVMDDAPGEYIIEED